MNPDIEQRLEQEASPDSRGFAADAPPTVLVITGVCRPIMWTREEIAALGAPDLASADELFERLAVTPEEPTDSLS